MRERSATILSKLADTACKLTYVACLRCEYSLKKLLLMARPMVPHRLPSSFGVMGGLHNRLTRSYTQNPSGIQDEFASAASPEYWPSCGHTTPPPRGGGGVRGRTSRRRSTTTDWSASCGRTASTTSNEKPAGGGARQHRGGADGPHTRSTGAQMATRQVAIDACSVRAACVQRACSVRADAWMRRVARARPNPYGTRRSVHGGTRCVALIRAVRPC